MSLAGPTVKVPRRKQSAAEKRWVYEYVEKRDGGCVAAKLDPTHVCKGPIHRHHAGLKMGMAKITDVLHVCLLCYDANEGSWARIHDDEVLDYIKDKEEALERARHDISEDMMTPADWWGIRPEVGRAMR